MILIKPGVKVTGMRPEILLAIVVAQSVFEKHGKDMVVTSILDGKHSRTSLHYAGSAVDIRIRDLSAVERNVIHEDIKRALTADYDVLLESTHLHIEAQPRGY